jgi:NAD(P)H-hydrate epimerase
VQSGQDLPGVCMQGNPGMASAGMGDVLSGILGGLLAQGLALQQATELATLIHAMAGDRAAENGERGLLATDLYRPLRSLVNPLVSSEIENG